MKRVIIIIALIIFVLWVAGHILPIILELVKNLLNRVYKLATLEDFFPYGVGLLLFTIIKITSRGTKEFIIGGERAKFKGLRYAIFRLLILICVVALASAVYSKYINVKFKNNLKFISSHSSSEETQKLVRILQFRWCQMDSRYDYKIICDLIYDYAQKNGIKLPW